MGSSDSFDYLYRKVAKRYMHKGLEEPSSIRFATIRRKMTIYMVAWIADEPSFAVRGTEEEAESLAEVWREQANDPTIGGYIEIYEIDADEMTMSVVG